jgi:hypothetical protein
MLSAIPDSAVNLLSELDCVSQATLACGAYTVAFQPSNRPSEDRHLVEDWQLADGTWKFLGIFDGARFTSLYTRCKIDLFLN